MSKQNLSRSEAAKRYGAYMATTAPTASRSLDAFSYRLLDTIAEPDAIFSPYNIAQALALVMPGASGQTQAELVTLFGADFVAELRELQKQIHQLDEIEVKGSSAAWFQEGLPLLADYQQLIEGTFAARVSPLNFADNVKSAKTINAWVSEQTEGKIKRLVPAESLNAQIRLVLTSALFFRGAWPEPLDRIGLRQFFTPEGPDEVEFMQAELIARYGVSDDLQVVRLPYRGRKTSLELIISDHYDNLAERMSHLDWSRRDVIVDFPLFSLTQQTELLPVFKAIGLNELTRTTTDLDRFTGEPLQLSGAVHKAIMDVDELGTVAAAATGMFAAALSLRPAPIQLTIDHPFLAIVRGPDEVPLFVGRVSHPKPPQQSTQS